MSENFNFMLDTQEIKNDKPELTGAQIKALLPGINPTYQLYLEMPGTQPDRPVADAESVSLSHKGEGIRRFYTVPPATFGA